MQGHESGGTTQKRPGNHDHADRHSASVPPLQRRRHHRGCGRLPLRHGRPAAPHRMAPLRGGPAHPRRRMAAQHFQHHLNEDVLRGAGDPGGSTSRTVTGANQRCPWGHSPGQAPWCTRAAVTIQCQSVEAAPPRAPAPQVHSQCQRPRLSHETAGWWLRRAVRLRVMVLMPGRRPGTGALIRGVVGSVSAGGSRGEAGHSSPELTLLTRVSR
jgi:hypothetical protein